jgi:hypothetical protein
MIEFLIFVGLARLRMKISTGGVKRSFLVDQLTMRYSNVTGRMNSGCFVVTIYNNLILEKRRINRWIIANTCDDFGQIAKNSGHWILSFLCSKTIYAFPFLHS